MKHHQPVRRMSEHRKKQHREYLKLRKEFLQHHTTCQACYTNPSTDVHHQRGRVGRLLMEVNYWIPVCRECHDWIHANRQQAQELGLLAGGGQWNVFEP